MTYLYWLALAPFSSLVALFIWAHWDTRQARRALAVLTTVAAFWLFLWGLSNLLYR